jgi:hypothetical protein
MKNYLKQAKVDMKLKEFFFLSLTFVVIAFCLWQCKDDISGGGPIDIVFPDSNISYGRQVQPLFDRGCAFNGCHGEYDAQFGLKLDNWQNALSSSPGVIYPKDTANSRIIWRIEGTRGLARMPPIPRTALNDNQKKGIRRWILEGAQNN